jgi:CRP/FNR family transcriptional regulator, nitrogen fixation regulation protein
MLLRAHPQKELIAASTQNVDSVCGLSPLVDAMRKLLSYRRDQEIYGSGDLGEHWYCMMAGAARKYTLMADGRRRIIDFLLPGDFFGFRARHQEFFAIDAIVLGTKVARYPRRGIENAADADPRLARRIRDVAFESISRSQARLLILGRVTALEKVHAFLDEFAERSCDGDEQTIVLPMSRYDIADYLAVSVETVSRALTELKRRGSIRYASARRIRILDHEPSNIS